MTDGQKVPMTIRSFFFDDPFFKNSWDDFDAVRDRMFGESRDMWKKFDEDFRNLACMSNNIMVKSSSNASSERKVSSSSMTSSTEKKIATSSRRSSLEAKNSTEVKEKVTEDKNTSVKESNDTAKRQALDRQTSLEKWENGWMFPRRWMLPSLKDSFKDMNLFQTKDSEVIRVKEDDSKMEVSLDTSQYRPDELNVSVANGVVSVEGKHEEKAEDGSKMVSRQFVRKYTLPRGTTPEDVVSNLSSDGVLVITAKKNEPKALNVKITQN